MAQGEGTSEESLDESEPLFEGEPKLRAASPARDKARRRRSRDKDAPRAEEDAAKKRAPRRAPARRAEVEPAEDDGPDAFEFKPEHDRRFAFLGLIMQVVACVGLAFTAIYAVVGYPGERGTTLSFLSWGLALVIGAVVGVWTFRAGSAFKRIAETRDNDVAHLMDAVSALTKLYVLQIVLLALAIFVVIAMLMALSSSVPALR